jgi:hypothetical protein
MAPLPTSQRLLWALAAFASCAGFFWLANVLAADVRYPLAIFCCVVSFLCFCVGVFLVSRRLAEFLFRIVMAVIEFFLGSP